MRARLRVDLPQVSVRGSLQLFLFQFFVEDKFIVSRNEAVGKGSIRDFRYPVTTRADKFTEIQAPLSIIYIDYYFFAGSELVSDALTQPIAPV